MPGHRRRLARDADHPYALPDRARRADQRSLRSRQAERHQALAEAADLAEALEDAAALVDSLTSLAGVRFNAGIFPRPFRSHGE